METCAIFESIQSHARNAADPADELINANLPVEKLKLELIQLLLHSAGIKEKIDENLTKDERIGDLVEFVENKSNELPESTIPLHNAKFFRKCVSFFERIFLLDWNTFTNGGHFKTSYFIRLLEELSECEPTMLHVLCYTIRLKLVTAYLRGACVQDEQKSMPQVKAYAKGMLEKAIFYRAVQCSIQACSEFYQWIKIDDSWATDKNLRLIAWSLKMSKPKLTCHALLIAYSLLRMENLRDQLTLFVRKLVSVFEDLCFTENNSVFDGICRCCEPIYEYHREAILPAFLADLLDNLYVESRSRAKSVAGFWISSVFDPNCHRKNIRTILEFLRGKRPAHWKLLVDSIIDDYPVLLDFNLQVDMLIEDETVPQEIRLTIEEKEGLLKLMSYTVTELTSGLPPESRAENITGLDLAICHEYECKITDALLPRFWDLLRFPFENVERAQITLILIAKSFNFRAIERTTMGDIIGECLTMFKTFYRPFSLQVLLEMLSLIMKTYRDDEVQHLCECAFGTLENYCKSQFIELIDDLLSDPDKFADLNDEAVKIAERILIRVMALNRVVTLSKELAFDGPRQLLQTEAPPRNPTSVFVLYVSVGLMSKYIIGAAGKLKDVCEELKTKPEEYEDIMCDIEYLVKRLSMGLRMWYPWSDLSVETFLNLCKVLEAVKDLSLEENSWNTMVAADSRFMITTFVAQMVWRTNDARVQVSQVTKTHILSAFLRLMEKRALPLLYAYDAMTNFKTKRQLMEEPLREFIRGVCAVEEESKIVKWILSWMIRLFQMSSKDCLGTVADFVELIYPIRKEMQNIIRQVDQKGISFALGSETENPIDESCTSKHEFLDVIAKLSECLDEKNRKCIEKYFKETTFKKNHAKVAKNFLKQLKKRPSQRTADKSMSMAGPTEPQGSILSSRRASQITPEEGEPPWTPSPGSRSSSVFADESDIGSLDVTDISMVVIRSNAANNTSLPGGLRANSTPNEDEAMEENMSLVYDDVSEFLQNLANERAKRKISLVSSDDGGITNGLANASMSHADLLSQRQEGKSSSVSSRAGITKELANASIADVQMVSEPGKGKSPSLSNGDDGITKGLANSSISHVDLASQRQEDERPSVSNVDGGIRKGLANTSISDENILIVRQQNESPSLSSGDDGITKGLANSSISDVDLASQRQEDQSPSLSNTGGGIPKDLANTSTSDQDISIFRQGSKSPSLSSGDGGIIKDLANTSISDVDFLDRSPKRQNQKVKSPSPSTQAESTSQVFNKISKFVDSLNDTTPAIEGASPKSPSMPVFGENDDISSNPLIEPIREVDLTHTNPSRPSRVLRSPIMSPQTKANDAQAESTSQIYDTMAKFVEALEVAPAQNYVVDDSSPPLGPIEDLLNANMMETSPARSSSKTPGSNSSPPLGPIEDLLNANMMETSPARSSSKTPGSNSSPPVMPNEDLLNAVMMQTSPANSSSQTPGSNTRTENLMQIYDKARKFTRNLNPENSSASTSSTNDDSMKKSLNTSISDTDSLSTNPSRRSQVSSSSVSSPPKKRTDIQVRSMSQEYDSIEKFLQTLNADNSSASASSGDDEVMKNRLNADLIDTGFLTASPPPATGNVTQAESSSQMYDNARLFVSSLDAENSSASESSGDNDFMKKRLNSSISDTELFAVSPIALSRFSKSTSSSPQTNRSQAQIESTSQQYDNLRKYVKNLNPDLSASESSGDEDLMRNLLNDSIGEADSLNVTPTSPIDDTQDLYNVLASDGEKQSDGSDGASKGVNDVAKNLQRVSLSNDESDESDSSSVRFGGAPPSKKKRYS